MEMFFTYPNLKSRNRSGKLYQRKTRMRKTYIKSCQAYFFNCYNKRPLFIFYIIHIYRFYITSLSTVHLVKFVIMSIFENYDWKNYKSRLIEYFGKRVFGTLLILRVFLQKKP